jgi:hypothetical protein
MATEIILAGTPFVTKKHVAAGPSEANASLPIAASQSSEADEIFAGISVRDGEVIDTVLGAVIPLQRTGRAIARVLGPCSKGDMVKLNVGDGSAYGKNYLSVDGNGDTVGRVLQDVAEGATALAFVDIGGGTSAGGMNYRGLWTVAPTEPYHAQDVVVVQAGVSTGTFIAVVDNPTENPGTGIGWVQLAPGNTVGEWG